MSGDLVNKLIARYASLRKAVEDAYGMRSQARVFVLYEELISLRAVLAVDRADSRVASRIAVLRDQIGCLYLAAGGDVPPLRRRVLAVDPPLLEFDRELFDQRYRAVCHKVRAQTLTLHGPDSIRGRLTPGKSYMFVVDDEGRMLVWARPFELVDLVFGRNRATVDGTPVAHPMLVPDRLRVRAAGEIVLIGAPRVAMVVANTKSGHFQPPWGSVPVIRESCRRVFDVGDEDVDVFHPFPSAPPETASIPASPTA